MTNLHAMKKSKVSFPQFWQQFFLHNLSMMYMFVYSPWCTSGCPWPKATVKRPVWNPGPKIEIPHPKSHVLKVFRFRSWKPRVWKCRPQSSDPKSWKHNSGSGSGPVTTQRVMGRTDGRTDGLQVHRRYKKKAEDQNEATGACCGNQLVAEASAWRFSERTAVAVPVLVRLPRKEWRVGQTNARTKWVPVNCFNQLLTHARS